MNIFEGSRRIAMLVGASILVVSIFNAFTIGKDIYVYYKIENIGSTPVLAESGLSECQDDAYREYSVKKTTLPSGIMVSTTLCFPTVSGFKGGEKLIPYKMDKTSGLMWGADKYNNLVRDYAKEVANEFQIPVADHKKLESISSANWWRDFKAGFMLTAAGLVVLYIFTLGVGWIVRGFMGIPHGQDSKPSN
jgi:hypothetical protein